MAIVETETGGGVTVIRMNRPERMNALGNELRARLAEAWTAFRDDPDSEVAIFTGSGRAFCAGEDMKESLERPRRICCPKPEGWRPTCSRSRRRRA